MIDIEQRIQSMKDSDAKDLLLLLILALYKEDTDLCYKILRDHGLEQDQLV